MATSEGSITLATREEEAPIGRGPSWVCVKVWGPFACFTRTEASVERVSYECMTPAAARNILHAVLWKPEFRWEVREIRVLNPINWMSIARNEVTVKGPATGKPKARMFANDLGVRRDEVQRRVLRSGLVLTDVAYVILARIVPEPRVYEEEANPVAKYRDMFDKRVRKGRCVWQPYLGMKDHHGFFAAASGSEEAIDLDLELGPMRYDVVYEEESDGPVRVRKHPTERGSTPVRVRASARVVHFDARLESGVLKVPSAAEALSAGGVRRPINMTVEGL